MSEGINPLEHAHYKSEELEKARQLLDDAKGKLDEAAKIFCSIMHDKDECYEECSALNKEGWVICYIYDSFEDVDMMLEKIDFLMKSSREKEGENNAR